jgi:hypothetical protein
MIKEIATSDDESMSLMAVICDNCGEEENFDVPFGDIETTKNKAQLAGWLIEKNRHICPFC